VRQPNRAVETAENLGPGEDSAVDSTARGDEGGFACGGREARGGWGKGSRRKGFSSARAWVWSNISERTKGLDGPSGRWLSGTVTLDRWMV
jgi:hypothetical protein